MDIEERIKIKLNKIDEDYKLIKPYLIDYMIEIEEIIMKKEKLRNESIENYRNLDFTISSISEKLGISRTVCYNHNGLLKKYIDLNIEELNKNDIFIEISNYKEHIDSLKNDIELLSKRDIQIELLNIENEKLKNKVKSLKIQVNEERKRRMHDKSLIKKLRNKK